MTFGDQGIDPCARRVVERAGPRGRRRARPGTARVTGAVLLAAVAAGTVTHTGGDDGVSTAPAPATTATTATTADTPPAPGVAAPHPAPLAHSAIRPEQAFPETGVRLESGSRYERVDLATTPDCARGMPSQPAALVQRGEGCLRLTAALFTDVERRSQVTVTVLSFRRAEDASVVFERASVAPVAHRAISLDPPPGAGVPTVPPGSAGVFRRLMTDRSVVLAHGRWGDGARTEKAALTRRTEELLRYAGDRVAAHEQG
ncbi:hypothetical protein ABT382_29445 [Streptomyces pharetrae]|uniref:hypothetical protein n=1 Tax=Streptomyces pharetrae TaxID=291370 RepID=UPI00334C30AA